MDTVSAQNTEVLKAAVDVLSFFKDVTEEMSSEKKFKNRWIE